MSQRGRPLRVSISKARRLARRAAGRAIARRRAAKRSSGLPARPNASGAPQRAPQARRPPAGPLRDWAKLLPARRCRVVLLAVDADPERVTAWLAQFPNDEVHVMSAQRAAEWPSRVQHHPADGVPPIVRQLRRTAPVDVIAELAPRSPEDVRAAWRELYGFVAPHGMYVVERTGASGAPYFADITDSLARRSAEQDPDARPVLPHPDDRLAGGTKGVVLTPQLEIVRKRTKDYLVLRAAELPDTLVAREPNQQCEVMARRPGGTVRVSGSVVSHASGVEISWLPEEITYPGAELRRYEGRVNSGGEMLYFTDTAILPDAFRWWMAAAPRHRRTISAGPSFARVEKKYLPTMTLPGTYYQLDCTGPGHFGHVMTEAVGKLWAWDEAKREIPELKALHYKRARAVREASVEYRLFRQYGIADEDIVSVTKPCTLTSLVSPSPLWHNADPHFADPLVREVWDRLSGIAATDVPTYDRIFVSRTDQWWRRRCRNVPEVEDVFRAHGFEIVYPETIDLSVQAAIFRDARVVAGFGGSAMFSVMYSKRLETMIVLNHEAYLARNEHLYSALLGCDLHYFWSTPDIVHPPGGFLQGAFESSWAFDMERNRADLEQVCKDVS